MAEATGSFNFKNSWDTTNRSMGWKITLTEGDLDYTNNTSRVYYYFGLKANNSSYVWSAANSNWIAMGFDSDATYDDEYNCRYNSSGTLYNTNWKDGYYFNNTHDRKMMAWCNSTSYQPLVYANSGATLSSYTTYYTTDGTAAHGAYRTITHNADGSGSAKFGVIFARAADSNCNGLVGAFPKQTLTCSITLANTRGVVKIYNGSAWVNAIPFVYNGSAWQQAIPYVYDGSAWKVCGG